MNYEYFIAKRIAGSKSYKSSISAPIIKIGIAAIAIGIVVMMVSIATGIGLQQKIRDKVSAFNGHISIKKYDSNVSEESGKPISKEQSFYPDFTEVEGVNHIQAVATKFGVIRTETDFEGLILKGVDKNYKWNYFEEFLVSGSLPDYSSDKLNNTVLMSSYIAGKLKLQVGDDFQMLFTKQDMNKPPFIRKFTISGIYNSGFLDLDKMFLIGDLHHIQRMNKWESNEIGNFEIFIDDYSQLEQKKQEIHAVTSSLYDTKTVTEKYSSIFEWVKIFDKNIYGIIGIMILVAGINMIIALLVLILERTQMIGILKALGSNSVSIRKVFLYNASYLIIRGLFFGNFIGLGLLFAQKYFKLLPLNPEVYYVTEAPVYINLGYIVALNLGTLILSLLMLLIPSYIITKISPIKAIRF